MSASTATYEVRIADRGATVVEGNVALTLAIEDIAEIPVISGNRLHRSFAAGVLLENCEYVTVDHNVISESSQDIGSEHPAISIASDTGDIHRGLTITNNVGYDDQGTPTQARVVTVSGSAGTMENIYIAGNVGYGNVNDDSVNVATAFKTQVRVGENIDGDGTVRVGTTIRSFTDADTTPSVQGVDVWLANNSGATDITDLDDGGELQTVTIRFNNSNTTIKDASTTGNFQLAGGADFTPNLNDILVVQLISGVWYEKSRSAN